MKIELTNKRVIAVIDKRSDARYPTVVLVVDEELGGEYPNHLAFEFAKDLEYRAAVHVGDRVSATGYLGSRAYQGKYYTQIRGTYCKTISRASDEGERQPRPPADPLPRGNDDNYDF